MTAIWSPQAAANDPSRLFEALIDGAIRAQERGERPRSGGSVRTEAERRTDRTAAREDRPLSKKETAQLQQALNELGYDVGAPTGVPGKRTGGAVARFLRAKGLDPQTTSPQEALRLIVQNAGGGNVAFADSASPAAARSGPAPRPAALLAIAGHTYLGSFLGREEQDTSYKLNLERAMVATALANARVDMPNASPSNATIARLVDDFLTPDQIVTLFHSTIQQTPGLNRTIRQSTQTRGRGQFLLDRSNEFDRQEIIESFSERHLPSIASFGVKLPARIVLAQSFTLGAYDFARGGFEITPHERELPPTLSIDAPGFGHTTYKPPIYPERLLVSSEKARSLIARTKGRVYLAGFGELRSIAPGQLRSTENGKQYYDLTRGDKYAYDVEISRYAVYADVGRTELVAEVWANGNSSSPSPAEAAGAKSAPGGAAVLAAGKSSEDPAPAASLKGSARAAHLAAPADAVRNEPLRLESLDVSLEENKAVRLGGHLLIPGRSGSSTFSFDRLRSGRLRSNARSNHGGDRQLEKQYADAMFKAITAFAFRKWARQHEGEPTPVSFIAWLASFYLRPQEVESLTAGLTDRRLLPFEAPDTRGDAGRLGLTERYSRLDQESATTLQERFDRSHRARILAEANRESSEIAIVNTTTLREYDFDRKAFPLGSDDPKNSPISSVTDEEIGGIESSAMWVALFASYDRPSLPSHLMMPPKQARDLVAKADSLGSRGATAPYRSYVVHFGSVRDVDFDFDGLPRFNIQLDIRQTALFTTADFRGPLLSLAMADALRAKQEVEYKSRSDAPIAAKAEVSPPPSPTSPSIQQPSLVKPQAVDRRQAALHAVPPSPEAVAVLPSPIAESPAPPASVAEKRQFDILGIRLDMTAVAAAQLLEEHMPGVRKITLAPPTSGLTTFSNAEIFVRADNREYVALVTHPPLSGDRLVAIGRYVFEGLGAIRQSELVASLREKYGEPAETSGQFMNWHGAASPRRAGSACLVQLGSMGAARWTDQQGKEPVWSEYTPSGVAPHFRGPSSMPWLGLRVTDLQQLRLFEGCGPTVAAWLPEVNGSVAEFSVWMTNTKAYIDILTNVGGPSVRPKL